MGESKKLEKWSHHRERASGRAFLTIQPTVIRVSEQTQFSFYKIESPPKASHVWQDTMPCPEWLVRSAGCAGGQPGGMGGGQTLAFSQGRASPARLPEPLSSFRPGCLEERWARCSCGPHFLRKLR